MPVEQSNDFQRLVSDLSRVLGPSSGLDCADVDTESLMKLMEDYQSKPEEWRKYAMGDHSRGYTRNLVDKGNGKSNLVSEPNLATPVSGMLAHQLTLMKLILVWTPGKGSPIHDHSNAHCIMKVKRLRASMTIC